MRDAGRAWTRSDVAPIMDRCRQHAPRPRCSKTPSTCRYGWRPTGRRRSCSAASAIVRIGEQLRSDDAVARVRGWWRHVDDQSTSATGARLQRTRRLLSTTMALVGAIIGVGVALTAFHYDGTRPVNVVTLLAALVVLPSVLLLATLLLIPGRIGALARHTKCVGDDQSGRGRRRVVSTPRAATADSSRRCSAGIRVAPPPPRVLANGNCCTGRKRRRSRFSSAAITTAIVLVTFTDLAFGWSTTLAADPVTIERLVRAIALPWATLFPSAVPDLTLIERSQFFRLDGGRALAGCVARTRGLVAVHDPGDRHLRCVAAAGHAGAVRRAAAPCDADVVAR